MHEDFEGIKITQVVNDPFEGGNIFALDHELNLVKIDSTLLDKGGIALYKLINFLKHG